MGGAILISDKWTLIKDLYRLQRRLHYIRIKVSIQEEVYVPNVGAPQYKRQMQITIRAEIDTNQEHWVILLLHS